MALSVAAAKRPAPATVEAADFNRVRRSMAVILDHEMIIAIIACEMMGCDYFGGKTFGDTPSTPPLPYPPGGGKSSKFSRLTSAPSQTRRAAPAGRGTRGTAARNS